MLVKRKGADAEDISLTRDYVHSVCDAEGVFAQRGDWEGDCNHQAACWAHESGPASDHLTSPSVDSDDRSSKCGSGIKLRRVLGLWKQDHVEVGVANISGQRASGRRASPTATALHSVFAVGTPPGEARVARQTIATCVRQ